jgi:hypothetical protein
VQRSLGAHVALVGARHSQCHLARAAQAAGASTPAVTTTLEISGAVELSVALQLTEDTKTIVELEAARCVSARGTCDSKPSP